MSQDASPASYTCGDSTYLASLSPPGSMLLESRYTPTRATTSGNSSSSGRGSGCSCCINSASDGSSDDAVNIKHFCLEESVRTTIDILNTCNIFNTSSSSSSSSSSCPDCNSTTSGEYVISPWDDSTSTDIIDRESFGTTSKVRCKALYISLRRSSDRRCLSKRICNAIEKRASRTSLHSASSVGGNHSEVSRDSFPRLTRRTPRESPGVLQARPATLWDIPTGRHLPGTVARSSVAFCTPQQTRSAPASTTSAVSLEAKAVETRTKDIPASVARRPSPPAKLDSSTEHSDASRGGSASCTKRLTRFARGLYSSHVSPGAWGSHFSHRPHKQGY